MFRSHLHQSRAQYGSTSPPSQRQSANKFFIKCTVYIIIKRIFHDLHGFEKPKAFSIFCYRIFMENKQNFVDICSYILCNVIFYKFKSRIYLVGISQSRCYSFCQIVICSSLSDSNNPLILIMNPHTAVNHTGNTLETFLPNVCCILEF